MTRPHRGLAILALATLTLRGYLQHRQVDRISDLFTGAEWNLGLLLPAEAKPFLAHALTMLHGMSSQRAERLIARGRLQISIGGDLLTMRTSEKNCVLD